MAVTLNGIDIETLTGVNESQRPRLATTPLGIHSLQLAQSMKATLEQYDVRCIWTGGNADYATKKAKLQNIADAGLPVWFDAQDWSTNTLIFGKVSDVQITQSEGRVGIWDVQFLITAVFPWGYLQITSDDSNSDFRVYDIDKMVQSRTLNPMLRFCEYTKVGVISGTVTFSFFVKNVSNSTGDVVVEMMVPDGIQSNDISVSPSMSIGVGDLGDAGISNTPGTLRRVTMTKTISGNGQLEFEVIITYSSLKTSFLDGSVDDIAP